MIEIRGRQEKTNWHEVSEEKAINYAKLLLKLTGIKKKQGKIYIDFLNKYIRGLDLEKIE